MGTFSFLRRSLKRNQSSLRSFLISSSVLDDEFVEMEEEVTVALACYVDEHLELFAEVVKE